MRFVLFLLVSFFVSITTLVAGEQKNVYVSSGNEVYPMTEEEEKEIVMDKKIYETIENKKVLKKAVTKAVPAVETVNEGLVTEGSPVKIQRKKRPD